MICENCKYYQTMKKDGFTSVYENGSVFNMVYKKGDKRCTKVIVHGMTIINGEITKCSDFERKDDKNV